MPKWKPGMKKGKPVDVKLNMPLYFALHGGGSTGNNSNMNALQNPKSENDKMLKATLTLYPDLKAKINNAKDNYRIGTDALTTKQYKKAISYFTYSIDKYPMVDAYFNRSAAYLLLGDTCRF